MDTGFAPLDRVPAARLEVDELVVRTYTPDDAQALDEAVGIDLEHLRPWMPWIAHEPQTVAQRAELIATWAGLRAAGQDTTYGIFEGDRVVGGTGLHRRGAPDVLEIGYWVASARAGRRVARRVAAALTAEALRLPGIAAVDICHDRTNARSRSVPEGLGFGLVEEARRPRSAPAECGWFLRWRTTAEQRAGSSRG